MDMLLKPRKGRRDVLVVLSKLRSGARSAVMVSSPRGRGPALPCVFSRRRQTFFHGALPVTHAEIGAFFFFFPVLLYFGIKVLRFDLTLQHHRQCGVTLLDGMIIAELGGASKGGPRFIL